jgi:type II secretory pathway component PulF
VPYFNWYALDGAGGMHKGVAFVRSAEHLKKVVKDKGFKELVASEERSRRFFNISLYERAQFFHQLATLLRAGIRVADALTIAERTVDNSYVRLVIADCAAAVREGIPLSKACGFHTEVFTAYACHLLLAGEESGALATACRSLAEHYEQIDMVSKKVRATLLLPAITFGCFFIVLAIIFTMVIPRFATLLVSLHKPLPRRTELLIGFSNWLNSLHPLMIVLAVSVLLFMGYKFLLYLRQSESFGKLCLSIPYVNSWFLLMAAIAFFRTLGSLLTGGVDIAQALSVAVMSISSKPLRARYAAVAAHVRAGHALSDAFQRSSIVIAPTCQAMMTVGEATGTLGPLLLQCADYYQQRLYTMLAVINQLIQPLILIVLGLLVAVLVFILYEPILTLSVALD